LLYLARFMGNSNGGLFCRSFGCGRSCVFFLAFHIGHRPVVSQAHGFEPGIGATPGRRVAWGGSNDADHPFGVGWNKAVQTYAQNYSPPEGGAAAITTNDYLMLGTQLGVPGFDFVLWYTWGFAWERRRPAGKLEAKPNPPARRQRSQQFAARVRWQCWWRFGLMAIVHAGHGGGVLDFIGTISNAESAFALLRRDKCGVRNAECRNGTRCNIMPGVDLAGKTIRK